MIDGLGGGGMSQDLQDLKDYIDENLKRIPDDEEISIMDILSAVASNKDKLYSTYEWLKKMWDRFISKGTTTATQKVDAD